MADLKVKIVVDGKEEYISVEKLALSLSKVGKAGAESASGINKSKRETDSYKKSLKELQEPMEKVEKTFKTISKATGAAFAIGAVMSFKAGIDALRESQLKYNNSALATVNRYDQAVESIKSAIANTKIWQSVMEAVGIAATNIENALGGASGGLLKEKESRKKNLEDELKNYKAPEKTSRQAFMSSSTGIGAPTQAYRTKSDILSDLSTVNDDIARIQSQLASQAKSDLEFLKTAVKDSKTPLEAKNALIRVMQIKDTAEFGSNIAKQADTTINALNALIEPAKKAELALKPFSSELGKNIADTIKQQESARLKMLENKNDLYAPFSSEYGVATPKEMIDILNQRKELLEKEDEQNRKNLETQKQILEQRREYIDQNIQSFSSFANIIGDALTGQAKGFKKRMLEAARAFASELIATGILSALSNALGGGGGIGLFGQLFGGFRANGGDVQAGRAYIVGEKRPELFVPKTNGTIIPDGLSSNAFDPAKFNSSLYNNRPIQVENKITVELDSQQIDAGIKTNGARLNARRGLVGA